MDKKLAKEVRQGHYEKAEDGLFLPKSKIMLRGVFEHDVRRNGELLGKMVDSNLICNEGLNYILNAAYEGSSQSSSWYIGIFKGNYAPQADDTAANITARSTEATEYTETTREIWTTPGPTTTETLTNSAARATFTINSSITVYGAFLVNNATKSGTTGILSSVSQFAASRALVATDELLVTYTVTATST